MGEHKIYFCPSMKSMKRNIYIGLAGMIGLIAFSNACRFSQDKNTDSSKVAHMDTLPLKGFLFGDDRPFPECHASSVIHLADGRFIAVWFGGTEEKNDDVGIWMVKGKPGHWEKPFEVAKINNEPHWNPVLFQSPQGKIFLFFKVGKEIAQWETWVKTSSDTGKTWSDAYELVKGDRGGRGPVRNKMIVLSDGSWLAGASNENGGWNVFFDRSADEGKTWQSTPYVKVNPKLISGKGVIQPTMWESGPGQIHALLRSTAGVICQTDSKDGGKTWSEVYKTGLPNPNSAIDVARLSDGTLVLACNPDDKNWGSRGTLALLISSDNGHTWNKRIWIEQGNKDDEFSYPAVISFGDTVMVTYTWKREKIAFWIGTRKWLLDHAESF